MALVLAECRRRNLTVFREDAGEVVTVAETALLRDRGDRLVALKQIQSGEFQFFLQNKVLRSNRETAVKLLDEGAEAHMRHRRELAIAVIQGRVALDHLPDREHLGLDIAQVEQILLRKLFDDQIDRGASEQFERIAPLPRLQQFAESVDHAVQRRRTGKFGDEIGTVGVQPADGEVQIEFLNQPAAGAGGENGVRGDQINFPRHQVDGPVLEMDVSAGVHRPVQPPIRHLQVDEVPLLDHVITHIQNFHRERGQRKCLMICHDVLPESAKPDRLRRLPFSFVI